MSCIIRLLALEDKLFLWEMLYQALHVPEGQPALPREVIHLPELARYVQGWGQPVAAVWLRLLMSENKGYGYVGDDTPELSIAVLPEYRGQGIGTELLTCFVYGLWQSYEGYLSDSKIRDVNLFLYGEY
jgi:GNAT superfamily N-acetyltransferase